MEFHSFDNSEEIIILANSYQCSVFILDDDPFLVATESVAQTIFDVKYDYSLSQYPIISHSYISEFHEKSDKID